MNEVLTELKAFRADAYCDCGGKLASSGTMLMTNPPKYMHYCLDCGAKDVFPYTYPRMVYREVSNAS